MSTLHAVGMLWDCFLWYGQLSRRSSIQGDEISCIRDHLCLSSALLKAKTAFRQQTQDERTLTSRVHCLLETVFQSQGRRIRSPIGLVVGSCRRHQPHANSSVIGPAVIKHTHRNVLEGRRKDLERGLQQGTSDALLREPKTFVLCNRMPSYSVLWSVLGVAVVEARFEWSVAQVTSTRERRQPCNTLFSLSVVLNRNTLALSTIRSTERGR
jgi:hypothetical protein